MSIAKRGSSCGQD